MAIPEQRTDGRLVLTDYFSSRRILIDRFLAELRPNAPAPLEAPLRRSLASAGKRVRGVLTLAVGETIGAKPERLVPAAAAMEMIHASSLVLDDLPAMDDALLRRGAPTASSAKTSRSSPRSRCSITRTDSSRRPTRTARRDAGRCSR
jgi:geranylgeranyl pyrophosphate synthase